MENDKLKDCPFCGKPVKLEKSMIYEDGEYYQTENDYYIKCENEDCYLGLTIKADKDKLLEWWNKADFVLANKAIKKVF